MRLSRSAALVAATALILTGCADSAPSAPETTESPAGAVASDGTGVTGADLTLDDGWTKAVEELPDPGTMPAMTGVFGTLTNPGDTDLRLTGGSSPVASAVELHETVMSDGGMVMREAAGGLVVPATGTLVLEPGGHHIMLMGLVQPVPAGEDVEVVLRTEDGTEVTVTAPARTFAGAEETYAPGQPSHTSTDS